MIVSVRQRGGLFGVSRTVKVDGRHLTVRERGRKNGSVLSPEQEKLVLRLATEVSTAPGESGIPDTGPDAMLTELVLRKPRGRSLRIVASDNSPAAVWELVGTISDAADNAQGA